MHVLHGASHSSTIFPLLGLGCIRLGYQVPGVSCWLVLDVGCRVLGFLLSGYSYLGHELPFS
eukprot:725530-Amorphochlora_amoeboformis.AAC.1